MHVSKDFIENVSIIMFLFIWREYIYIVGQWGVLMYLIILDN